MPRKKREKKEVLSWEKCGFDLERNIRERRRKRERKGTPNVKKSLKSECGFLS